MDFQGLTETRNYSVVLEHLNADLPAVVNMELTSKRGQPGHGAAHERHGYHGELPKNAGAHSDHNQQAGHSVAMFRDKFWLSLLLTLPLVFGLDDVQHWLGYRAPSLSRIGIDPSHPGHDCLGIRRQRLHSGGMARAFRPPAGHDELDQLGYRGRFCGLPCCHFQCFPRRLSA